MLSRLCPSGCGSASSPAVYTTPVSYPDSSLHLAPCTLINHHSFYLSLSHTEDMDRPSRRVLALLCESTGPITSHCNLQTLIHPTNLTPANMTLRLPTAFSITFPLTATPQKLSIPPSRLFGPVPTPVSCPDLSRAAWLAARSDTETPHLPSQPTPRKPITDKVKEPNRPLSVPPTFYNPTHPLTYPPVITHNAPLHAFYQRIPVVVASVAEAEYAPAFGGGQVLVKLTLTLPSDFFG